MDLKVSHRLAVPKRYDFFNKFNLTLRYDSVASVFGFEFYFDPENQEHAELFAVSHFHEAIVGHNGETLVTGFILKEEFKSSAKKELTAIGGYSKTGVLEDCTIPTECYPLQVDGLTLSEIAKKLCDPFKLKVVIDDSVKDKMNKKLKSVIFEPTDKVKEVLTKLAIQYKIVITHNENGDLLFTQAKTDQTPLFDVIDGTIGTSMRLVFNGQVLHSHITVIKEASSDGGNAGQVTIRNPYVPVAYTYRPITVKQSSGDDISIEEYAYQILAEEIRNGIKLIIDTDRWNINGKIIKPNNIINVFNKELFLYQKEKWFMEEISYEGNVDKTVASIQCVLPCSYDGTKPKNIFVNPHENFPRSDYKKNFKNPSAFLS